MALGEAQQRRHRQLPVRPARSALVPALPARTMTAHRPVRPAAGPGSAGRYASRFRNVTAPAMIAITAYPVNTANPVHGANMCGEPGWETVDQIWLPALNGTHLSTWSCQLDGKKLTSTNSTNSNPIPALIAAAVCRSSVPRPNASIPHAARNSPPPITARSTPGSPRLAFRCLPDRMAWPMKNDRNEATSPVTRATTVNTTPLAASTVPRRGCTVSDVRIIPVEYSDVTVSAPSTT